MSIKVQPNETVLDRERTVRERAVRERTVRERATRLLCRMDFFKTKHAHCVNVRAY